MALSGPIKYMTLDVEDRIRIKRLRMMQASSFTLSIQLLQGDVVVDLTDADLVQLVYSDNDAFQQTIIGTVASDPTTGIVNFAFTPINTADAGVFEYTVSVAETGVTTLVFPYGQITLLAQAGTDVQGALPSTGIVLIDDCADSPYSVALVDHAKTFVLDDALACNFTFNLPTISDPDAYIGTWWRFISRNGPYILTIKAANSDTIDDSNAGGTIRNVDNTGLNPNDWSSITLQIAANVGGVAWIHAITGRRIWSTSSS